MQKILVVDDNPESSEPLINSLKNKGFNTILCEQEEHTASYLKRFKPTLILLDIVLPTMNGLQICKELRLFSDVPIIIMSAKSGYSVRLKSFQLGADDYVNKPLSIPELLLRIKSVIKRSTM